MFFSLCPFLFKIIPEKRVCARKCMYLYKCPFIDSSAFACVSVSSSICMHCTAVFVFQCLWALCRQQTHLFMQVCVFCVVFVCMCVFVCLYPNASFHMCTYNHAYFSIGVFCIHLDACL